jgi:hypothetical protein
MALMRCTGTKRLIKAGAGMVTNKNPSPSTARKLNSAHTE